MTASLGSLGLLLGSSWASGINLYLTVAGLGIAHRMQWLTLPGQLETISHPAIIALALILYAVEFFADKIPYVDSGWDAIHTAIRPAGGAMLAYLATTEAGPVVQTATALLGGTIALDSHVTKAGTRAMINTSPEPFTNIGASVTEDVGVLGAIWLMITNPLVIAVLVILFVLLSIWIIPKIFRLFAKIFGFLFGKKKEESIPPAKPN